MTITATTNLSLPLITTGTESGTWGDDVNNGLTAYLDIAIAGGLAVTITTNDVTLTNTAGTSSATNIGSTSAQYAILNISGAKTAARNLIVPSSSKYYLINNAGTGGFLLTVKGAATSGVTLIDGEKAIVAWNGTDYVKISGQSGSGTFYTVTATAPTTASSNLGAFNYGTLNFSDTGIVQSAQTSVNSYFQNVIQNTSAGTAASAEFIAYNDQGTASTNYATVGINSSGYTGTGSINAAGYAYFLSASTDLVLGTIGANGIHFTTNSSATDALAISSAGAVSLPGGTANGVAYLNGSKVVTTGSALTFDGTNLGVGVTPSAWASSKAIQIGSSSAPYMGLAQMTVGTADGYMLWGAYLTGNRTFAYTTTGDPVSAYRQTANTHAWFNAPSGTAGNAITFTQAMALDASGNLLVGGTTSTARITGTSTGLVLYSRITGVTGDGFQISQFAGDGNSDNHQFFAANTSGSGNAAATMYKLGKASTGRSINAAGTINAAGLDYAEYMTKAGGFTVAKGDVVGINAEGKLINVFADAVSFAVKSTNPSYVGGDTWGTPEALGLTKLSDDATQEEKNAFATALEAARQTVDRIAFAGQVPVNVTGATAGQYIVPVNDNGAIKGEAVSNPTFEQYQKAVGKVIAIEQDGRAKIIVKVA